MTKLKTPSVTSEFIFQPRPHAPQIRWPFRGGGLTEFPDPSQISSRPSPFTYSSGNCVKEVLKEFFTALINANECVRIIDKNFLQNKKNSYDPTLIGPNLLEIAIKSSTFDELKIITDEINYKDGSVARDIEIKFRKLRPVTKNSKKLKVTIKDVKRSRLNLVHDRFAIVDEVLWHFGSDVGGRDPNLNAVSFGWDATQTRATSFFEDLWGIL